ncbi:Transcriptional regulator, MerR family [Paenibacillus pasadenensis]|uniref:Transcriptional regulator, MerR family n=1 Tax=Paenibacillus pasadenensis TaxID=217090 RepID=A0A2N5N2M7_9BACL|nr:Transcriptional regulator, MerR family [Paenibacillus pasadenensis]
MREGRERPQVLFGGGSVHARKDHLAQIPLSKQWIDYFNDDESSFLQAALPSLNRGDKTSQHYVSLLRRIEWCVRQSIPPESEEGLRIASELMKLSLETFQGDEQLMSKFWEVRKLPAEQSGLYPVSNEVLEFVEKSLAYASEKDGD